MVSAGVLVPQSTHICTGDVQAGILPFEGGTHGVKVRQRRPNPHVRVDGAGCGAAAVRQARQHGRSKRGAKAALGRSAREV